MKALDEITQMMAAGETALADEALKELLAKEPDNLQAKMLYGTCRQLLGDEETFKRIHDELAPVMEKQVKEEPKAETISLWKKYHALWLSLIVGGLVLAGISSAAVMYFGKSIKNMYAAPGMDSVVGEDVPASKHQRNYNQLYGPAIDRFKVPKADDDTK